jgi:hypothetical protein
MGVTYFYVNLDKRQFFTCGLFGRSSRYSGIGLGPSARALAILLSDRGTWRNDRISIVGDTSEEFSDLLWNGLNIEVEVVLMLIDVDGLEWVEAELDDDILAFEAMCDLAFHLRHLDVVRMLDRKHGAGKWQRKYEHHVRGNTDIWAEKVIEARDRGIKILA